MGRVGSVGWARVDGAGYAVEAREMGAGDVVDLAAHDEVVRDGPAVPDEGFAVGELLFREERSDGVEEFAEGHTGGFGREDAKDGVAHEGVVGGRRRHLRCPFPSAREAAAVACRDGTVSGCARRMGVPLCGGVRPRAALRPLVAALRARFPDRRCCALDGGRGADGGEWMNVIWCLGHIFGPDRRRRCQGACMEGRE